MTEFSNFLLAREKTLKEWKQYPDFFVKKKNIGKSRVVLIGGKKRGAVILAYYDGKDYYTSIFEEINFMDYANAAEDYSSLKTNKDILNLMMENS